MSTNRRQFLIRGAGLAATAAVPGSLLAAAPALAASTDETKTVTNIVGLEQASALMYTTIAENKAVSPKTKGLIDSFHGQEESHVNAFSEALSQLGESAPNTPTDVADIPELKGLGQAKSEKELLGFAIKLEEKLVAAYLAGTSDFETADLIRSGAQVGANHMQHLAVLRLLSGLGPDKLAELPKPKAASEPAAPATTTSTSTTSTSTSTDSTSSSSTSTTDSSTSN